MASVTIRCAGTPTDYQTLPPLATLLHACNLEAEKRQVLDIGSDLQDHTVGALKLVFNTVLMQSPLVRG